MFIHEEFPLHTSCFVYSWGVSLAFLMLILVRNFSYTDTSCYCIGRAVQACSSYGPWVPPNPFSPVRRCLPATGRCAAVRYKRQCLPGFCRGEHRTRDWKVAGSNPCWNGGRIFFSRVDFLCWLLFRYPFHPRVTTVARKKSRTFCQKCRWQVTAKHAYTLRMWILLNRASALVTTCP